MTALPAVAAVLLWLAVVFKVRSLMKGGTQRLLWFGIAVLATGVTLEVPPVAATLDEFLPSTPNVAHLIKHTLVVAAAALVREVARDLALPPGIARAHRRRRGLLTAVALVLLVGLYVVAPVHDRPLPGLTVAAVGEPALLGYWAIYLTALSAALVSIVQVTWTAAQAFPPGSLRVGMTWMGAGAVLGLAYCAHKAAYLAASTIADAGPSPTLAERVQTLLLATTVTALVIGVLVPNAVRWPLVRHLIALRTYRRLHPLWQDYYDAEPGIALGPGSGPSRATSLRDIEARLYRHVIEIRDGMLAVRPYAHHAAREVAVAEAMRAGHRDPELIGEAVWLEIARRAKLRGEQPADGDAPAVTGGTDLSSEARLLTRIAKSRKVVHALADRIQATVDGWTSTS